MCIDDDKQLQASNTVDRALSVKVSPPSHPPMSPTVATDGVAQGTSMPLPAVRNDARGGGRVPRRSFSAEP